MRINVPKYTSSGRRNTRALLPLVFSVTMLVFAANAQVNVELRINHMLGSQTFQTNTTAQNNLTEDFQVTRLEYYVSRITVVHDSGQLTAITDDTIALVDAADGPFTTIELGNLNVTTVEGVRFHIGVYTPINNADPSLQPAGHPLAPQSPSMHWGWSAGYRFLAMEGVSGSGFSQIFQLHGLGNSNYFETQITAGGQMVMGTLIIPVDADYTNAIQNISVSGGIVSHGSTGEALTALQNFNSEVFSQSSQTIGISEISTIDWELYPNPATPDRIQILCSENDLNGTIEVRNTLGQLVKSTPLSNSVTDLSPLDKGHYFVSIHVDGMTVATKKLIIN